MPLIRVSLALLALAFVLGQAAREAPSSETVNMLLGDSLTADPLGWAYLPTIAATKSGLIYAAWSQHVRPADWQFVGTYVKRWKTGRWEPLGGRIGHAMNESGAKWPEGYAPSIAVLGETPYVAWYEGGGYGWGVLQGQGIGSSVFVAHWDGARWIYDTNTDHPGGALNSRGDWPAAHAPSARQPRLAVINDILHAVWIESRRIPNSAASYDVIIEKHLAGSRWVQNAPELSLTRGSANALIIDVGVADVSGVLHIAWSELARGRGSASATVQVVKRGERSWNPLGGVLNTGTDRYASYAAIASVNGIPYVAWQERTAAGNNRIYVKHWDGARWIPDGGALNVDPERGEAGRPALSGDGTRLRVAWAEGLPGQRASVYTRSLGPTGWSVVSGPHNVTVGEGAADTPGLAEGAGRVFLIWAEKNPPPATKQVYVRALQ